MTSWFGEHEQDALRDFWVVYDASFEAVLADLIAVAPERRTSLVEGARERMRRAVAGDWASYEDFMRAQAIETARGGLAFATWQELIASVYVRLTPLLVDAYASDPPRLSAALTLMQRFGARAARVLGEAFLGERERLRSESEDVQLRARLRAELRFSRLSGSGILGVVVGRIDRTIVEINDAALQIVGHRRQDILSGKVRWTDLTPPEWAELDARALRDLAETGVGGLREKEYLHADGRRVPVLVGSAMIDDEHREIISFILDLTARKQAEALAEHHRRLRGDDALFRALVESVHDYAIFAFDPEGNIATWNRGAERLKGYTASEIIGQRLAVFYTPEDLALGRPDALLHEAREKGQASIEGWRVRRDGSRFWASVRVSAMRDEAGRLVGFAKVTRDRTESREAATALRDANHELEAFSYSVAHDLRAPLRAIGGFSQLLLREQSEALVGEAGEWLEHIVGGVRRMNELIDALLSLGRVGRAALRAETVDLSALATSILTRSAASEPDRRVEVVVTSGLFVQMDHALARALLENLLHNAWKFTAGVADARIELGAYDDDEGRTFFVRDNGAGFDMAYAGKLFAPFQRLHTVAEFPGTGIGLATAQRIIRRHGGRIWAEAVVGKGATFFFHLPPAPA